MTSQKTLVKICGLKTPDALTAAIAGGADFVGLVFHPASPRHLDIEVARYLAQYVPPSIKIVGLFVDPTDDVLKNTLENVRLDLLQLHGHETINRVKEIRENFKKPVIKALSIETTRDIEQVQTYSHVSDWLLLDAKGNETMPGGNGLPFDWTLLKNFRTPKPWMLAGGLTPDNVLQAIETLRPDAVDVSSGVESSRGVKDPEKIRAFLENVRQGSV